MRRANYLALKNDTKAAANQGGAASISVTVRLNPSVAVRVGKNALNDRAITSEVNVTLSHQTFQSEIANRRPRQNRLKKVSSDFETFIMFSLPLPLSPSIKLDVAEEVSGSSWSPILIPPSSSMRLRARDLSCGDSQRVVVGKSGRIMIAKRANATVRPPSMKNSHLNTQEVSYLSTYT